MDKKPMPDEKKEKPIEKIFTIILVVIILIAAIFLIYFNFFPNQNTSSLTTTYTMISSNNAYDLINNSTKNLKIIDIRSCKCNYEKNHLPRAIWDINPKTFYNTTDDLLVYDSNGASSIDFCRKLVNNTYGKIMYLEGGINNWIAMGYPIIE